jgi:O-antigen/teichoic acid export membrane protein
MDVRRYERELGYGPSSITEVVPLVVVTLAAWPVAKWFGDYRAVLVLLLGKALLSCTASHLLAERPYSWRGHSEHIKSVMRFGWPLVVNGFMMFGIFQGEQFLVATFYPMAELASYAAAMTLGTAPAYVLGRIFHPVVLPVLAKAQDDPELFRQRYRLIVSAIALFAAASGVSMMVGAEALMRLLYGQKYTNAGIVLACLAAAGSVRLVRTATSVAALAKGDSQNEMWSNGARMLGLLPALALVMQHQAIWLIACTGLIGEALACCVAIVRLRRRDNIPNAATLIPLTFVVAWISIGAAVFWAGESSWPIAWSLLLGAGLAAASSALAAISLTELRQEIVSWWRGRRNPVRTAESAISVSIK